MTHRLRPSLAPAIRQHDREGYESCRPPSGTSPPYCKRSLVIWVSNSIRRWNESALDWPRPPRKRERSKVGQDSIDPNLTRTRSYQQFFHSLDVIMNRASSTPEREQAVRLGVVDFARLMAF